MILLDMINKTQTNISSKMFTHENNILTLEFDPQDYDITAKVITASFSMTEVETMPLEVVNGIIQLPIHSNLIKYGINYIQLNFRWDNKLEQSGKISWKIDTSIATSKASDESINIISHLISEVNRVVGETGDIKEALDESVTNANTIHDTLTDEATGTIKIATDTGIDLEDTIEDANYVKGLVEATIDDSEIAKTNLEGTIGDAGTAQTNLNNKIGEATTSKQVLDQAVIDNQIVTLPVFNEHKLNYATRPCLKSNHSANISIPNLQDTPIPFDNDIFIRGILRDKVNFPTRFICTDPGLYLLNASIEFALNASGYRLMYIKLNGVTTILSTYGLGTNAVTIRLNGSIVYKLNENDYLEVAVYQNTGIALNVVGGIVRRTTPIFDMIKVVEL